jgi:hypothetical protein
MMSDKIENGVDSKNKNLRSVLVNDLKRSRRARDSVIDGGFRSVSTCRRGGVNFKQAWHPQWRLSS